MTNLSPEQTLVSAAANAGIGSDIFYRERDF
jgi:hypothetical protein